MELVPVDEPLISEILPDLFMGGTDDYDTIRFPKPLPSLGAERDFDSVATMYAYAQPMGWYVNEWRYGLADGSLSDQSRIEIRRIAIWLYGEWRAGKKVLSRCQQGWNRSGLVVALILIRAGYSAEDAISLIRERRGRDALCNPDFVDFIYEVEDCLVGLRALPGSVPVDDVLPPPQTDWVASASGTLVDRLGEAS